MMIAYENGDQNDGLVKYLNRGWEMEDGPSAAELTAQYRQSPFCPGLRSIGDRHTLAIPLDTTGVDVSSPYFAEPLHDGLSAHSWGLHLYESEDGDLCRATHDVTVWGSPALRHRYLIAPPLNTQVRGIHDAERSLRQEASSFK